MEIVNYLSFDCVMCDVFCKVCCYLMMVYWFSEDEVILLLLVGVDFGVMQVVDVNWGVYGMIRKNIF